MNLQSTIKHLKGEWNTQFSIMTSSGQINWDKVADWWIQHALLKVIEEIEKEVGLMKRKEINWAGTTDLQKNIMLLEYDVHNAAIQKILLLLTSSKEEIEGESVKK